VLTLSQRRAWARRGAQEINRTIAEAKAEVAKHEAEKAEQDRQKLAAYREAHKPVPFTTEQLKSAKYIRTDVGWHKVVRVNAKSVSVETGYSWVDRYKLDKVLEVRS
jgi:hypothetical protein